MSLTFEMTGTAELEAAFARAGEHARRAAAAGLFQEGNEVIGDAQEHYVPVDLATLKNSGHAQLPETNGNDVTVRIGFGGAAAPYALAVHEHLSEHSPPSWKAAESSGRGVHFSPAGHGPKYLERPLMARAKDMVGRLADAVRGALR